MIKNDKCTPLDVLRAEIIELVKNVRGGIDIPKVILWIHRKQHTGTLTVAYNLGRLTSFFRGDDGFYLGGILTYQSGEHATYLGVLRLLEGRHGTWTSPLLGLSRNPEGEADFYHWAYVWTRAGLVGSSGDRTRVMLVESPPQGPCMIFPAVMDHDTGKIWRPSWWRKTATEVFDPPAMDRLLRGQEQWVQLSPTRCCRLLRAPSLFADMEDRP